MPTINWRHDPSSNKPAGSPTGSDQILGAMHKVFSHDLPNQMVVLQSLLQLLDQEESALLSDKGREYVGRLLHATKRGSDMVRFLKEMSQLNARVIRSETISLSALARELQGELRRLHPARQFEFAWQWNVPAIVGDPRLLLQAMLELFAGFLHPEGETCRVSARSERYGEAIELAFHVEETAPTALPRANPQTLEQRMEIILAREWLALSSAGVELAQPEGGVVHFSIVVPNR
jgi:light-regulated signal transduction histidine kinase (bacteriophytochrome)